jgi:hypothetical protein
MAIQVTHTFTLPIGKVRYFQTQPDISDLWWKLFDEGKIEVTKQVQPLDIGHKITLKTLWHNESDFQFFESKIAGHTDAMNEYNRINNIEVTRVVKKL